ETNSSDIKLTSTSKNKIVLPGLLEFNNFIINLPSSSYTDKSRLESYFSQINYDFKDTYYLSASIRRDGSSRFVKNKWDTFGSIGGAWIISNESFIENSNFIKFLKLKASYGIIGEQAGVGYYPGLTLSNINNSNDEISITEDFVGNPDLTWEKSKMYQVGLESQLSNFLDINLDYYIKDTENLLFDKRLNIGSGVAIQDVNDGTLRNSGLEFDINAKIINKEDFKLGVSLNGEFLKNKLTAMPIDVSTGEQKVIDIDGVFGRTKGRSLYDFYTREWAGVDPANGAPMWYAYYYDANNDGVFNESDDSEVINSLHEYQAEFPDRTLTKTVTSNSAVATRQFLNKSSIPTVRGGFRLNMSYKNFDFSSQLIYSLGGYAYDAAYADMMGNGRVGSWNWHKNIRNRWQNPADITNVPALT
ncbi:TonB-dependent receptor domain-containing protein, partial [Tenacibaculum sp. L6]|uniref:TonB-dependent receptor domain-containing protein n=1 Tax=Tenacibaculum sp. L6 TaxID=2992764 RepID=UPI00237A4B8E